jgi:hypothetical protein
MNNLPTRDPETFLVEEVLREMSMTKFLLEEREEEAPPSEPIPDEEKRALNKTFRQLVDLSKILKNNEFNYTWRACWTAREKMQTLVATDGTISDATKIHKLTLQFFAAFPQLIVSLMKALELDKEAAEKQGMTFDDNKPFKEYPFLRNNVIKKVIQDKFRPSDADQNLIAKAFRRLGTRGLARPTFIDFVIELIDLHLTAAEVQKESMALFEVPIGKMIFKDIELLNFTKFKKFHDENIRFLMSLRDIRDVVPAAASSTRKVTNLPNVLKHALGSFDLDANRINDLGSAILQNLDHDVVTYLGLNERKFSKIFGKLLSECNMKLLFETLDEEESTDDESQEDYNAEELHSFETNAEYDEKVKKSIEDALKQAKIDSLDAGQILSAIKRYSATMKAHRNRKASSGAKNQKTDDQAATNGDSQQQGDASTGEEPEKTKPSDKISLRTMFGFDANEKQRKKMLDTIKSGEAIQFKNLTTVDDRSPGIEKLNKAITSLLSDKIVESKHKV